MTAGMTWIGKSRPNSASRTRSFSPSVTEGPSPLVPKGTMPRTPISASQKTCSRYASSSTAREPSSLNGVTLATYTPSISRILAPPVGSSSYRSPRGSPPQRSFIVEKGPQLILVGQALVVPEGRDAQGAHRVGHAQTFLCGQVPQMAGQVSGSEGVAGSHGIDLRHREGGMLEDFAFRQGQAPRAAPLENHLLRSFARQLPHQGLVVTAPERPRLLIPGKEQVDVGQDLLDELSRLLRPPQLRTVVNVEANAHPGLPGGPQDKGAAVFREGRRDARQVQETSTREVIQVERFRWHRGGCRPLSVVIDTNVRADLLPKIKAGGMLLHPAHPRGVYPLGADAVEHQLAWLVVTEVAGPPGREPETGEGDGEVRLGAPDLELQATRVAQTPRPRRNTEDHRLARCYHVEVLCQLWPLLRQRSRRLGRLVWAEEAHVRPDAGPELGHKLGVGAEPPVGVLRKLPKVGGPVFQPFADDAVDLPGEVEGALQEVQGLLALHGWVVGGQEVAGTHGVEGADGVLVDGGIEVARGE